MNAHQTIIYVDTYIHIYIYIYIAEPIKMGPGLQGLLNKDLRVHSSVVFVNLINFSIQTPSLSVSTFSLVKERKNYFKTWRIVHPQINYI